MSTSIHFPKQAWRDLAILRDTEPLVLEKVHQHLSALTRFDAMSIRTAIENAGVSDLSVEALFRQLVSLYPSPDREPPFTSFKSVVTAIDAAAQSLDGEDRWQERDMKNWRNIQPFLQNLLTLPAIDAFSKGFELRYEQEHILTSSRIISDLRPIFRTTGTDTVPIAGLIVHTLRLRYGTPFSDSTDGVMHFALDVNDLQRLHDACERALAKHTALGLFATEKGLPLIDLETEITDE